MHGVIMLEQQKSSDGNKLLRCQAEGLPSSCNEVLRNGLPLIYEDMELLNINDNQYKEAKTINQIRFDLMHSSQFPNAASVQKFNIGLAV